MKRGLPRRKSCPPDFGAVTAAAAQSRPTERMTSPFASSIELNIVLPHRNFSPESRLMHRLRHVGPAKEKRPGRRHDRALSLSLQGCERRTPELLLPLATSAGSAWTDDRLLARGGC